jgi:D-xylose transport system substrate-binding protein
MTVYKKIDLEANGTAQLVAALSTGTDTTTLTTGVTTTIPAGNGAASGVKIPSILEVPVAVDKSNIATTVIADGFVTAADVCTGLPSGTGGFCP